VLVCVLVSVAATLFGARSIRSGNASGWRVGASVAVLAGLAAVVVQLVQYTNLGFGAGDGSFASVFVGWTVLLTVNVLAVVYWLWILLAESLGRVGRTPELIRPSAEALALYWSVLAVIEVTAFILLYVVA
jgi:heme/copper-type cytochrome/quinol oxidase subunit 3